MSDCVGGVNDLSPNNRKDYAEVNKKKESVRRGATEVTGTVRSAVPNPTMQLVDPQEVEHYNEHLKM